MCIVLILIAIKTTPRPNRAIRLGPPYIIMYIVFEVFHLTWFININPQRGGGGLPNTDSKTIKKKKSCNKTLRPMIDTQTRLSHKLLLVLYYYIIIMVYIIRVHEWTSTRSPHTPLYIIYNMYYICVICIHLWYYSFRPSVFELLIVVRVSRYYTTRKRSCRLRAVAYDLYETCSCRKQY